MNLAEKVAADFERENPEILDGLKDRAKIQEAQMNELRAKGKALSHQFTSFHLWISVLEGIGHPRADRVAREMRAVQKKIEGVLNG